MDGRGDGSVLNGVTRCGTILYYTPLDTLILPDPV